MFAQGCAMLAPWASSVVFSSPIPTIQKCVKEKSVGSLPLLPYTTMISSTFLWTMYGVLKNDPRIWSANLVGLVLGLYYFLTFIRICPKSSTTLPGSVVNHVRFILAMIMGTSVVAMMSPNIQFATQLIGSGGVALTVCLFASPLSVMKLVIEKKSAAAIPLPFTVASFINCFLWSVMGLVVTGDINIIIPNVLGLLCTVAQLALKFYYGDGPKLDLPR